MSEYILLSQEILENPLWHAKDKTKWHAWIDILLNASHKDEKILIGNNFEFFEKGTWVTSELKLADRWGWSRNKVRSFLNLLEAENMIEKDVNNRRTAIKVVDFDRFLPDRGEG